MTRIVLSQRVDIIADRGERRDALDQRWTALLRACGFLALPMANDPEVCRAVLEQLQPDGVLLTGGNDLAAYGGDAPERDATEAAMIDWASASRRPLLGVCRGMQMLARHFGAGLVRVEGHVTTRHAVLTAAGRIEVNSFHNWAVTEIPAGCEVTATAEDGTIEAFRHTALPIAAIAWHPERETPWSKRDMSFLRSFFGGI